MLNVYNSHYAPIGLVAYRNGLFAGCQNTFVRLHVLPCLLAFLSGIYYKNTELENYLVCGALYVADLDFNFWRFKI
jgi:hypothetical protein